MINNVNYWNLKQREIQRLKIKSKVTIVGAFLFAQKIVRTRFGPGVF